ncbi:hypothetical protein [Lacticaseibacillus pantheris]|jgi:hypothetical protein|uniref:hypothetical protein n=1 Tax=Lacticaseibacillus pantheris TaxID=171523 RepID=UPI000B1B43B3|nr:hypothetical protein [Lacticaseibacillus pantheris]
MSERRVIGAVMMVIGLGFILGSTYTISGKLALFVLDAVGLALCLWGQQLLMSRRH